jgi:predicted acylesterase/phospholipase RssA
LGELALALSGGGYRAAAFHLGVLRFLQKVELLDSVTALSTVSGGTILGCAWTVSRMKGVSFSDFDAHFSGYLQKTNVIGEALRNLKNHRRHGRRSKPSLIGSAAHVYARPNFLGHQRFGELLNAPRFPFRELIFNSTEFFTGVDFRFRRSDQPDAVIGNGNLRLPRPVAEHVRLADIVAASSCFPGGFEPLQFPDDFQWPQDFPLKQVREALPTGFTPPKGDTPSLPLMDGGIYDNQGVDSLVLAFEKAAIPPTLLISDVDARKRPLYSFPRDSSTGWLTLRGLTWLGRLLFAIALATLLVLFTHGWATFRDQGWQLADYALYLIPALFSAGVAGALVWSSVVLRDIQERVRSQFKIDNLWNDLRKLTVREAIGLLELRATSLVALTSSVFMKHIRDLIQTSVFKDTRYRGRRIDTLIYDLQEAPEKLCEKHPWLRPSEALIRLSRQAEEYPTTLWLDDPRKDLDVLTQAGEATTCFNLLKHLLEDRAGQVETAGSPVQRLFQRLREEWEKFNASAQEARRP